MMAKPHENVAEEFKKRNFSGDTDVENKHMDTKGGKGGWWNELGDWD